MFSCARCLHSVVESTVRDVKMQLALNVLGRTGSGVRVTVHTAQPSLPGPKGCAGLSCLRGGKGVGGQERGRPPEEWGRWELTQPLGPQVSVSSPPVAGDQELGCEHQRGGVLPRWPCRRPGRGASLCPFSSPCREWGTSLGATRVIRGSC